MSDSEGQSTPSSSLIEDAVCLEADEVIKGSSRDKIRWKLRWKRGGCAGYVYGRGRGFMKLFGLQEGEMNIFGRVGVISTVSGS